MSSDIASPVSTAGTAGAAAERATAPVAPAYLRIALALRRQIHTGTLEPHTALPPERELCQEHEVSRMTVRQALGVLEDEGLIYRSKTRGTFVAAPRLELQIGSFSHEVSRSGRRPGAQVLWAQLQPASAQLATTFGTRPAAPLHVLQRLRWADEEPIALETTYYPADLTPGLLEGDLTGSLWAELRDRYDVDPARTSAAVQVVPLDADAGEHLRTRRSAPGLQLVRHTYAADGTCVEYAHDLYRADRVVLTIDRALSRG